MRLIVSPWIVSTYMIHTVASASSPDISSLGIDNSKLDPGAKSSCDLCVILPQLHDLNREAPTRIRQWIDFIEHPLCGSDLRSDQHILSLGA